MAEEHGGNVSNGTVSYYHSIQGWEAVFWTVLYALEAAVAIFGNLLVIIIMAWRPQLRTVTNCFILNLCIADMITGLVVIPFKFQAALLQYWALPHLLCNIIPYIETVSLTVSVLTLCASAADRYGTVLYGKKTSNTKMLMSLLAVWSFSAISSLPCAIFHNTLIHGPVYQCLNTADERWWKWYSFYLVVVQYFMPLVVVDGAYLSIAYQVRQTAVIPNYDSQRIDFERNKRQVFVMLLLIVLCFTFCSLPFQVYTIISDQLPFLNDYYYIPVVYFICQWTSLLGTCLNPIIFAGFNKTFRLEIGGLFRMLFTSKLLSKPMLQTETQLMEEADEERPETEVQNLLQASVPWMSPPLGQKKVSTSVSLDTPASGAESFLMQITFRPFMVNNKNKLRVQDYVYEELGNFVANSTSDYADVLNDPEVEDEVKETIKILSRRERSIDEPEDLSSNSTNVLHVNGTKINPVLFIESEEAAVALDLDIPSDLFRKHQQIAMDLLQVCTGPIPKTVEAFDASQFGNVDVEEPIGIDVTALHVNLTQLAETLKNDTQVDTILDRFDEDPKTLGDRKSVV